MKTLTDTLKNVEKSHTRRPSQTSSMPASISGNDLSEKIFYVHHPDFDDHEAVHNILETIPETDPKTTADRRSRLNGDDYLLPNRPLLTREAERTLFLRMNLLRCMAARRQIRLNGEITQACQKSVHRLLVDADATRNKIVEANQRLVVSNASKFSRSGVALSDLISESNLALMKAIDHFDIGRGYRLSTYATFAIRRHLSRYVQREQKRNNAGNEEFVEPYIEEESAAWIDVHPGELVNEILAALPQRERTMVEMRYGLNEDGQGQTLDSIGQDFGISKERVRQLIVRSCAAAFTKHARKLGMD